MAPGGALKATLLLLACKATGVHALRGTPIGRRTCLEPVEFRKTPWRPTPNETSFLSGCDQDCFWMDCAAYTLRGHGGMMLRAGGGWVLRANGEMTSADDECTFYGSCTLATPAPSPAPQWEPYGGQKSDEASGSEPGDPLGQDSRGAHSQGFSMLFTGALRDAE
jgi:hypothetical protein